MIVRDISAAMAERLHRVFDQVYELPPAGEPEMPCAIIGFPQILNFHTEMSHQLSELEWEVALLVGRGDAEDAMDQLAQFISTEGERSVIRALEDRDGTVLPWQRLRCATSDTPRSEGNGISLTLTIEMHA